MKILVFSDTEFRRDEFKKSNAQAKETKALANLLLDGPIVGSDLSKNSAITSWINIPFDKIREAKELNMVLYDQDRIIDYQKYPRKYMFRVEVNIFREEIHLDRKKFVNLVELLAYLAILITFVLLYNKFMQ